MSPVEDTWINGTSSVPWNYIAIIEAAGESTKLEIFRYESKLNPADSLPLVHTQSQWSKTENKSIASDQLETTLDPLVEFAMSTIPEDQLFRTPLFLYGTGSFQNIDKSQRHEVLKTACAHLQDKTGFLLAECNTHIDYIDDVEEAILELVSANHPGIFTNNVNELSGILDLTGTGVRLAYFEDNSESKNRLFSIGLQDPTGSGLIRDVYAQNYPDLTTNQTVLNACTPRGFNYGTGEYDKCQELVKEQVGDIVSDILKFQNRPNPQLKATGDFSFFYEYFKGHPHEVEAFCRTHMQSLTVREDNGSDKHLENACFLGTLGAVIASQIPEDINIRYIAANTKDSGQESTWSAGRALFYSNADLTRSLGTHQIGIKPDGDSQTWRFGTKDSPIRPDILPSVTRTQGKDWYSKLNKGSHRLWGGLILIALLTLILYFLLGERRRTQIYQAIRSSRLRPSADHRERRNRATDIEAAEEYELQESNEPNFEIN